MKEARTHNCDEKKKTLGAIKSSGIAREKQVTCVQKRERGHFSLRVKKHKKDAILAPFSSTAMAF